MPELGAARMIAVYALVLLLAFTMAFGGILFAFAFRDLGQVQLDPGYVLSWLTHPLILVALALGLGARFIYYAMLEFINVSQITLFSALSIVATLILARVILKEELTHLEVVGALLIVTGVVFIGR